MLLWIAFAFLTAAVLAAVLAPLARSVPEATATGVPENDGVAIYRDQLHEIEADQTRGVLSPDEAQAAKLEVSRRLLASAGRSQRLSSQAGAVSTTQQQSWHQSLVIAIAGLVPLATLGLYLAFGSPNLPASPFAARTDAAAEQAALANIIAQVEARLRKDPEQGKGWEALAPVYLKLGRFRDAANAYANAARLNGETVALLAGRAEAAMLDSDGIVTEEARVAYEKILKLEPRRIEPRFWLAMAKEQDGQLANALSDYKALLAEAPPDAEYRAPLTMRIAQVSQRIGGGEARAPVGPSEADMAAAAKLTEDQRAQMIAQMVDGLAQRLKSNGRDLPGWVRLLNAYAVLDRKNDARDALAEARRNFDGDAAALAELTKLATQLGLGS